MRLVILGSILVGIALFPGPGLACGGSSGCGHGQGPSQHHATAAEVPPGAVPQARHGGYVFAGADLRYEISADAREVRVYAYDDTGEAVDLRGVDGMLRPAGGSDADDDAVALTYIQPGRARSGWLAAPLPARETAPAPGEYRIVLRDLPSRQEPEISIAWPPDGPAASPRDAHAGHQH